MRSILNLFFSTFLLIMVGFVHAGNSLKEVGKTIEDSVITAKITVKTQDGVVTLSGYVKNNHAFVDALRLVKSTDGVKNVEVDDLVIKQVNTALTDAYITAKVEAAVLKAKVFDDESIPIVGINAATTNGTVTLTGKVKQDKSVIAILKRVNAVRGVKKIISHLQVNGETNSIN